MATWRIMRMGCGATATRPWISGPRRAVWWWVSWKTGSFVWKRYTASTTARCAGTATTAGMWSCFQASSCGALPSARRRALPRNRWASTPGASISCCWMPRTTWWAMPWPTATPARLACTRWPMPLWLPRSCTAVAACNGSPSTPSTSCWRFSANIPSSLRRPTRSS